MINQLSGFSVDDVDGKNSRLLRNLRVYGERRGPVFTLTIRSHSAVAPLIVTNGHRRKVKVCCCTGWNHGELHLDRFQITVVWYLAVHILSSSRWADCSKQ